MELSGFQICGFRFLISDFEERINSSIYQFINSSPHHFINLSLIYQQDAPTEFNGIFYYSTTNRTLLRSSMELFIIQLPTGRSYGAQWNFLLFSYQQDAPMELNGIIQLFKNTNRMSTNRRTQWDSY